MIITQPDVAAATIYFIRPMTYRERAIADKPVTIEFNGMELLKIGKVNTRCYAYGRKRCC